MLDFPNRGDTEAPLDKTRARSTLTSHFLTHFLTSHFSLLTSHTHAPTFIANVTTAPPGSRTLNSSMP